MYAEKTDYDDIEMSSRLRNILRRNGFESLEGLREYPKEHFIKFRNMGQATLQELYQICEEQGVKLRSVEDLNDREHGVRFDDWQSLIKQGIVVAVIAQGIAYLFLFWSVTCKICEEKRHFLLCCDRHNTQCHSNG